MNRTLLQMNPARRFLGVSILAAWFLSLLLWIYIAMRVVTCDDLTGACYIDWYSPFFSWFPYISFLETGLIAFVVSFTCMVVLLTFWWGSGSGRSLISRFVGASLLTTWLYSILLFGYLGVRVIINKAPLNSPFIDVLFPWLTFLRLGILALFLGLLSFFAYLAFFWRSDRRSAAGGSN